MTGLGLLGIVKEINTGDRDMADYRISVFIKGAEKVTFKKGLGRGVISTCIVTIDENNNSPTSIAGLLHDTGTDMIKDCVDFKIVKIEEDNE